MSDTKLITKEDGLYLDFAGKTRKVLRGFESFNGIYHFATEIEGVKYADVNREEQYKECKQGNTKMPELKPGEILLDVIYFGFVQGQFEEWGAFSLSELQRAYRQKTIVAKGGRTLKVEGLLGWEIKKQDLPHAGRRHN